MGVRHQVSVVVPGSADPDHCGRAPRRALASSRRRACSRLDASETLGQGLGDVVQQRLEGCPGAADVERVADWPSATPLRVRLVWHHQAVRDQDSETRPDGCWPGPESPRKPGHGLPRVRGEGTNDCEAELEPNHAGSGCGVGTHRGVAVETGHALIVSHLMELRCRRGVRMDQVWTILAMF